MVPVIVKTAQLNEKRVKTAAIVIILAKFVDNQEKTKSQDLESIMLTIQNPRLQQGNIDR